MSVDLAALHATAAVILLGAMLGLALSTVAGGLGIALEHLIHNWRSGL